MTVANADVLICLLNHWWEVLDVILEDHDGHSLFQRGELALVWQGQAERKAYFLHSSVYNNVSTGATKRLEETHPNSFLLLLSVSRSRISCNRMITN